MRRRAVAWVALGLAVFLLLWGGGSWVSSQAPGSAPAAGGVREAARPGAPRARKDPQGAPPRSAPSQAPPDDADAAAVGVLRVRVVDDAGRPEPGGWASAVACELLPSAPIAGDLAYRVPAGPCVVRGARQDGQLTTYGDEVTVEIAGGGERNVVLEVPSARTGAMQLAFERVDQGLFVRWSPSPAVDGIAEGDIIVAIAGTPVTDLTAQEAVELLRGPVGTAVPVEVLGEGDTGVTVRELVRRAID